MTVAYCPTCIREVYLGPDDPQECPVCLSQLVPASLQGEPSAAPRARVLIVDDDEDVRDALRLLFEDDFEVVGMAADGREAIQLAAASEPDVIVLDQRMPHMTGAQAAAVLRRDHPRTRIVAFSAVLVAKPDWADAFLNKERIDEIAPLIGALLKLERASI